MKFNPVLLVLSIASAGALCATSTALAAPTVLGDIILDQDTLANVEKKLSEKPNCTFTGPTQAKDEISIPSGSCFKLPGKPSITIKTSSEDTRPASERTVQTVSLQLNNWTGCQKEYLPLLKESWGWITGSFTEKQGKTSIKVIYWEGKDKAVDLSFNGKSCTVTYYSMEAWAPVKAKIEASRPPKEEDDTGKL
ncbi:MAG: hypothetical protein LUC43_07820 [Burkholderiales bacterium]|nr:hypothetical protein [Burkholderiales bacterium]